MSQKIKVAVIGGTGKSGQYLVQQLLRQGYPIKLLLRNPARFPTENNLVEKIVGGVTDADAILSLVTGCQAVISTLGLGIPASDPTIFSQSTGHVTRAMHTCGIHRYIVTTGLNVDTPFDKKSNQTLMATDWMKKTYPVSTTDKQLEYEILANSDVDWTLVRLPRIIQTDENHPVALSLTDCPGDTISASDLAKFLVEQLSSDRFIRNSPFLANP